MMTKNQDNNNNKTKNKKNNKEYLKPFMLPIIISFILLYWFQIADSRFEQILIGFIFFTTIIPFTFQIFTMLLNNTAKAYKVDRNGNITNSSNNNFNNTNTNKSNSNNDKLKVKKNEKDSIKSEYKAKTNNNIIYAEVRDRLKDLVKTGQFNRQSILKFESELEYRLGTHKYVYDNFDFKNDMHKIYILLKSSKLTDDDYLYLKGVLEDLV